MEPKDYTKLTRIIQYGEKAKILFQLYRAKGFNPEDYDHYFGLYENKYGDDKLVLVTQSTDKKIKGYTSMVDFDKRYGTASFTVNTDLFTDERKNHEKDKKTAYNPRCYYLKLFRKLKNDKDADTELMCVYPPGYDATDWFKSEGKSNDKYLLDLSPEIEAGDHEGKLAVAAMGTTSNREKEEWEKEGKNPEEELKKRKERTNDYVVSERNKEKINEKLDVKYQTNYFLQLKVAKDTLLNKSLGDIAPAIIGEGLSCAKKTTKNCYCNRDFTVEEIKSLVKTIKGKEAIWEGSKGNNGFEECNIDDKSFEGLTRELNTAFRKHGINKCIQKIAILAETSVETGFFTCSEELSSSYSSSRRKYKGRGMIQLTGSGSGSPESPGILPDGRRAILTKRPGYMAKTPVSLRSENCRNVLSG